MKNWKVLAWFPAIVVFTAACRALIGLDEPVEGPADATVDAVATEASTDAGTDADANFNPSCIGLALPERPQTPAGVGEPVYFLAVNGLYLGGFTPDFLDGGLMGQVPAANLDCSNTCGPVVDAGDAEAGETRPTCTNPLAPGGQGFRCDLPGTPGFENGFFDAYGNTLAGDDAGITASARLGESTVIIAIGGYNGQLNDSSVDVNIVASTGLKRDGAECRGVDGGNEDGGFLRPKEDGCDEWEVLNTSLVVAGSSSDAGYAEGLLKPTTGYVRDGYLVVRDVPNGSIPLAQGGFGIPFTRGFFVARLAWFDDNGPGCTPNTTTDAGKCLLGTDEGMLAGIVPFRAALEGLMATRPVTNTGLLPRYCALPEGIYKPQLVDPLCAARDMTIDPNKWYKGEQCDAFSTALRFRARSARPWVVPDDGGKTTYETFCPDGGGKIDRFVRCEPGGAP